MEENPKPRRRWFRFSLRTLLVLVTLVCVSLGYLGWAANWKRQRAEFLQRDGIQDESEWHIRGGDVKRQPAPLLLRILGESGVTVLMLSGGVEKEAGVLEEAERLFPEAELDIVKAWGDPD